MYPFLGSFPYSGKRMSSVRITNNMLVFGVFRCFLSKLIKSLALSADVPRPHGGGSGSYPTDTHFGGLSSSLKLDPFAVWAWSGTAPVSQNP